MSAQPPLADLFDLSSLGDTITHCPKKAYATRKEARQALRLRRQEAMNGDWNRRESRIYHCPRCRDYHLTSRPKKAP